MDLFNILMNDLLGVYKIEDEKYVSIRETWGAPITTAPKKHTIIQDEHREMKKKRIEKEDRLNERLENIITIENAVREGESIDMENYEIEVIFWAILKFQIRISNHKKYMI